MSAARAAERKSAREGRKVLAETLSELGEHPAAERIGVAERSLLQLDRDSTEHDYRHLRYAIDCLADALGKLQSGDTPETQNATEGVARTLALLYPLTKILARKRLRRE
jgi:hypothetical protein